MEEPATGFPPALGFLPTKSQAGGQHGFTEYDGFTYPNPHSVTSARMSVSSGTNTTHP